ncbi:MAG TPA: putative solute-binding protein [Nevskiaceae bacterium]|nr:putative solute-binding protein [Nevskiaceae bacterium]
MHRISKLSAAAMVVAGALAAGMTPAQPAAAATVTRSFCIYDPIGANGFIYQSYQPYIVQALNWGVKLVPKPYTDEIVAMADFSSGKCDMVEVPGINNIHLEKFAGSLDMLGGLRSYKGLHTAIEVMSSPKAAKLMTQGDVETVGVLPAGKVFLYARDRANLLDFSHNTGKKVAILDGDQQAITFANVFGVSAVPASLVTFGPMFNNGSVDFAYAPAFAYQALELYKGLGTKGGVATYVLGNLTTQTDIHKNRFPSNYGQASRTWTVQHMWADTMRRVRAEDASIPKKYWVHIDAAQTKKYNALTVATRQRLWQENWYSHTMQKLLKHIRCHNDPAMAECSMDTEGGPAT